MPVSMVMERPMLKNGFTMASLIEYGSKGPYLVLPNQVDNRQPYIALVYCTPKPPKGSPQESLDAPSP